MNFEFCKINFEIEKNLFLKVLWKLIIYLKKNQSCHKWMVSQVKSMACSQHKVMDSRPHVVI